MKLSISNIGWAPENDSAVYEIARDMGFQGLEIAPTRIFQEKPYERLHEARDWSRVMLKEYGFTIPSMQSIWYGRKENLFRSDDERAILSEYTKKAIDFAANINCRNIVFGCPKNRSFIGEYNSHVAENFFREIGDYAASKGTVIGMEANPSSYGTNFVNHTMAAFELIERVGSEGFRLNLDTGTIIYNKENITEISGRVNLISHVHISEPGLIPVEKKQLHSELRDILAEENYQGFVSIEMRKIDDLLILKDKMRYITEIFNG